MPAHRPLVACGLLALVLGEGAFFDWDYASMLGGDPILLVILLAAVVLTALTFVKPARGLLLAAGVTVSLVPGIVLSLLAIALALPAAILGFRGAKPAP